MNIIKQNLQQVHRQIRSAAQECGRDPSHITLLAISKNKPIAIIKAAIEAGQLAFGENYIKEGIEKISWFRNLYQNKHLVWHFIGQLQSNKSRLIAENFDWCHTLDRLHLAKRLNSQRSSEQKSLNVLIQINISNELTKVGITPQQMFSLTTFISSECPRLKLRGLMAIPAPEDNFQRQLVIFKQMYVLYKDLQRVYPTVDTLSLGMTNDMRAAIIAGSTLVRIGTAIFGERV